MNPEPASDALQGNPSGDANSDCNSLPRTPWKVDLNHGNVAAMFGQEYAKSIADWVGQADNPLIRRNRTQIVDTFPLLLPALSLSSPNTEMSSITKVIDSGLPLIEAFASFLKVKKRTVRFPRGKELALVGRCWADNPVHLLSAIDAVPEHRRPTNTREWLLLNVFWQCSLDATSLARHEPRGQSDFGWHLFVGFCSAGYDKAISTILQHLHRTGSWELFSEFVRSFEHWCERRAQELDFSGPVPGIAMEQIAYEMLTHYSAIKLLELSEDWRQNIIRNRAHSASVIHWPALLPDPVLCDGLMVISLTDSFQLFKESESLNHCVSMHISACLRGHSHILAIRDASGESASTVEIRLVEDRFGNLSPIVVQHRSENNSEPAASCRRALSAVMHRLLDPGMQIRFRQMAVGRSERKQEIENSLLHKKIEDSVDAISEVLPDLDVVDGMLEKKLIQ